MPKKQLNISDTVMSRISRDRISMKPRWMFIVGSAALAIGIVGLTVISVFLVSLISFSLRTHGPMGEIRYQQLISGFPWWAPILAIVGLGSGIRLLHRYDFSYRKNFPVIALAFLSAIVLSGWLIDSLGLDRIWAQQGPFQRLYQKYDGGYGNGPGRRMNQTDPSSNGNQYHRGRTDESNMNRKWNGKGVK